MALSEPKIRFVRNIAIRAPLQEVFSWHSREGAFERLSPPWRSVEVLEREGGIKDGRISLKLGRFPFAVRWKLQHRDYAHGSRFRDVQISGPFCHWEHTHEMKPLGPSSSLLEDRIECVLPLGVLGQIGRPTVSKKLDQLFKYRHRTLVEDIEQHKKYGGRPMRVLISGASGLVGQALKAFLTTGGHEVFRLVRSEPADPCSEIRWNPEAGDLDFGRLEGFDAVVHLAGENIASGRWTEERKRKILDSRVRGTKLLAQGLTKLKRPPSVFVSASAIGYYGHRPGEKLTEASSPGETFLSKVCEAWEEAARGVSVNGIRLVCVRLGIVLSPKGGALAKMLPPFKLGLGGVMGSGQQYMSWVSLDDVVGAIHHVLITDSVRGAVNIVAPEAVTNADFTKTLGRVLGRPTLFPLPAFAARLALGEMADELLLADTRVEPLVLLESGYQFRTKDIEDALRHMLGRKQ